MTPESVIEMIRQALMTALLLGAPLLVVGFIIGIAVSLLQILTSIQDSAFSAVPRLLAFLVAFALTLPWMLQKMLTYTTDLFGNLGRYGR